MHVDDLADACIFFFKKKTKESLINLGTREEKKIIQYVYFLKKKMNLDIKVIFDKSNPDGTPRKVLNTSIARRYGWKPKISLSTGFDLTYKNYLEMYKNN